MRPRGASEYGVKGGSMPTNARNTASHIGQRT